jgi:hypothetical protein
MIQELMLVLFTILPNGAAQQAQAEPAEVWKGRAKTATAPTADTIEPKLASGLSFPEAPRTSAAGIFIGAPQTSDQLPSVWQSMEPADDLIVVGPLPLRDVLPIDATSSTMRPWPLLDPDLADTDLKDLSSVEVVIVDHRFRLRWVGPEFTADAVGYPKVIAVKGTSRLLEKGALAVQAVRPDTHFSPLLCFDNESTLAMTARRIRIQAHVISEREYPCPSRGPSRGWGASQDYVSDMITYGQDGNLQTSHGQADFSLFRHPASKGNYELKQPEPVRGIGSTVIEF